MKYSVRRLRINQGGYDSTGEYWGIGQPIYQVICREPKPFSTSEYSREYINGDILFKIRANDAEHAKALINQKMHDPLTCP